MKRSLFLLLVPIFIGCTASDSDSITDELEQTGSDNIEKKEETESTEETDSTDETDETDETDATEEAEVEIDLPQTWKLFKITCIDSETCNTEEEEMPFQDTYTFREDKTFLKVRVKEEDSIRIEGTFKVYPTDFDTHAFNLTYEGAPAPEDIEIISSCTSRKEYLYITEADHEILKNKVSACDGPDLYYKQ